MTVGVAVRVGEMSVGVGVGVAVSPEAASTVYVLPSDVTVTLPFVSVRHTRTPLASSRAKVDGAG